MPAAGEFYVNFGIIGIGLFVLLISFWLLFMVHLFYWIKGTVIGICMWIIVSLKAIACNMQSFFSLIDFDIGCSVSYSLLYTIPLFITTELFLLTHVAIPDGVRTEHFKAILDRTRSTTMNVCMILPGSDFPPDIRVEKEARALQAANHDVFILCDQKTPSRPQSEDWKGLHIIRRKRIPVPTLMEKFNAVPGWMRFLEMQWHDFIDSVVRDKAIDVLHIHDLPKVRAVLSIGNKYGLPVIIDLHENYPASLKSYIEGWSGGMRLVAKALISVRKWEKYEIKHAGGADKVIVVVDEAKNTTRKKQYTGGQDNGH